MIEAKLSISRIEKMLREAVKTVYTGEVFYHNRKALSEQKLSDFMVVKVNGQVSGIIATDEIIAGDSFVLVQLWAKDRVGEKNVNKLIEMRDLLMSIIPYKTEDYKITYKGEVGSRDSIGFHSEFINLTLQIF